MLRSLFGKVQDKFTGMCRNNGRTRGQKRAFGHLVWRPQYACVLKIRPSFLVHEGPCAHFLVLLFIFPLIFQLLLTESRNILARCRSMRVLIATWRARKSKYVSHAVVTTTTWRNLHTLQDFSHCAVSVFLCSSFQMSDFSGGTANTTVICIFGLIHSSRLLTYPFC